MSKKTSKKSKNTKNRTTRRKLNPAKKLNELNEQRDWVSFNKKVARLRGDEWKKKIKLATIKPDDSVLKMERIHQNISQRDMARRVGLRHKTSYARIEKRIYPAKPRVAKKIANILNTKVNNLFQKEPYKEKYYAL